MSVINQMLKDLEHRSPVQGQIPVTAAPLQKKSTLKIVIICTLILLSLNVLGFYIWHLQKQVAESKLQQEPIVPFKQAEPSLVHHVSINEKSPVNQALFNVNEPVKESSLGLSSSVINNKPEVQLVAVDNHLASISTTAPESQNNTVKNTFIPVELESVEIKPVKAIKIETSNPSKMSISRRELSPQELMVQKLAKAEKRLNANEISEAEKLFEEVLIIDASHKQARKKLAALWFGRQSYQAAVNLLSQGIALDRNDSELRLMKARIHLKQGQNEAAYNTLKPLAFFKQEEYQLMLANISQQTQHYSSAIQAYQILIEMQPYSGRWHLGLATVYDKNSQFLLALNEYALALTKADLSASSAKFAQQRMQALGE